MSENIFERDWRDCLEAHYMHVIRTNDRVTLPSLTYVMHQAGFDDAQLAELRVRATMHVDDVGADYMPDMNALEAARPADAARSFAVPEGVPAASNADAAAAALLKQAAEDAPLNADQAEDDPDMPQQLSLF